jgi:sialidase-1
MRRTHHVQAGTSWGTLTDPSAQAHWRSLGCDDILLHSSTARGRRVPQFRRGSSHPPARVYYSGLGGYRVFRIPALARVGHTLLAFAEARPTVDDHGRVDLVLRKSSDGGLSWGALKVVASGNAASQTIGNPVPIPVHRTAELLLLYCSNAATLTEETIRSGDGGAGRRVWIRRSRDVGETWSAPLELTDAVKRPGWTWFATGPGGAIALRNGTLVVPVAVAEGTGEVGSGVDHSRVLVSQDNGATWAVGGGAATHTNEAAVAQRADGSLLLMGRDLSSRRRRVLQSSIDVGSSWTDPWTTSELIESPPRGCHGSLASTRTGDALFFASPQSPYVRGRLTLFRSTDGGATWPSSLLLHAGPSAYSSMRLLPPGDELGVLYERGEGPHAFFAQVIVFERVPLAALDEGAV